MIHLISSATSTDAFHTYVIPLLKANGVKYHFIHDLTAPLPEKGLVLFMGGGAIDSIRDRVDEEKILNPKKLSIAKARMKLWKGRFFFTYDPNIIALDPVRESDILWDIQKVCRLENTGSLKPVLGDYEWVPSQYLKEHVTALRDAATASGVGQEVSLDLETMGLNPWGSGKEILTVSLTWEYGKSKVWKVPSHGKLDDNMQDVLLMLQNPEHFKMIGANLKYDIVWMLIKWDLLFTNQSFDTYLAGALDNENMSNSLNNHAKLHTTLGGYDDDFLQSWDKAHMEVPLEQNPDEFITYAGGDTDACFRLYPIFKKRLLADYGLSNFYVKVLQPAVKVFAKMEARGVCVDLKQYDEIESIVRHDMESGYKDLIEMIPRRIRLKHLEKLPDGTKGTKLKAAVIRDLMFTEMGYGLKPELETPTGQISTTKEHLAMFSSHPDAGEFIKRLREYRQAEKTLLTYVVGFRKHLRADGKFHPTYNMCRADFGKGEEEGTVTGRTSAADPPYQTIPKHTMYANLLRSAFVTPPGMVGICVDFSQGELRVYATLAGETRMIDAYNEGIDVHMITGAEASHLTFEEAMAAPPDERKRIRQGGKAGNFGLIYLISPAGFVVYARDTYQTHLTFAQAVDFQTRFFERWPAIQPYQQAQIALAKENKFVRSPLGRIRHLPLIDSPLSKLQGNAQRQAVNSPTQATLSDLGLMAMVEMDRRHPEFWFMGFVHDDLQAYVPEDDWMYWASELKEIMETLPLKEDFGWEVPLTFNADVTMYENNMGQTKEFKVWPPEVT